MKCLDMAHVYLKRAERTSRNKVRSPTVNSGQSVTRYIQNISIFGLFFFKSRHLKHGHKDIYRLASARFHYTYDTALRGDSIKPARDRGADRERENRYRRHAVRNVTQRAAKISGNHHCDTAALTLQQEVEHKQRAFSLCQSFLFREN